MALVPLRPRPLLPRRGQHAPGKITPRLTGTDPDRISGPATVHSRRRPWPYDLEINGFPVILREGDTGLMIGKKVQSLQGVAPITYDYSSQPVYAERTFAFRKIEGGYGERVQRSPVPARYYYALNADLSVGGLQMKGPRFHAVAPPTTGPIRWFLDAVDPAFVPPAGYPKGWPPLSTFAGAGRYVLKRTADTNAGWTVSKDFGAGIEVVKAVRYRAAGAGALDSMWVTTSNGELWQFNGTTWVKSAQPAFTITVLRDELWIKDDVNSVRKCTADPLLVANWDAPILVGDKSQPVTNVEVLDDQLYVFKTNGVFVVGTSGEAADRFPSFRQQPLPRNGVNANPWLGRLWFGYGDGYYWLDNAGQLNPTGPNLLVENNSEVSGEVTAFAGHASWFGYYGLWNKGPTLAAPGPGDSYLVKHGTWKNPEEDRPGRYVFDEVPNGALKKWTGKKVSALYVSDAVQGNSRLYAGFEDGSVEWCLLPRGTPNPAHPTSGCEFTTEDSWVYWPIHHAMFQADLKSYRGFSVFGPRMDSENTVRVQYRLVNRSVESDPPSSQSAWREAGRPFALTGQRNDLDDDVFGQAIEVRHGLFSTDPTPACATPVIEGVALHEQVRPALLLEYTWTINARRHLARRDGVVDRRTPWQIREAAMAWAATAGTVEAVLPDEGVQALSVVDYSEALSPVTKRYGADWDVAMKAVQFRTLTVYGSWDRVAQYDWDTIADYTWDDLLYLCEGAEMAYTDTANIVLHMPIPGTQEPAAISLLNENCVQLDAHDHLAGKGVAVGRLRSGTTAGRPSPTSPGLVYFDTDEGFFYIADGTTWARFHTDAGEGVPTPTLIDPVIRDTLHFGPKESGVIDAQFKRTGPGELTVDAVLRVHALPIYVGRAGNGTGGNLRLVDDGGTDRWLWGIPGSVGARDLFLYDLSNNATRMIMSQATGGMTIGGTITSQAAPQAFICQTPGTSIHWVGTPLQYALNSDGTDLITTLAAYGVVLQTSQFAHRPGTNAVINLGDGTHKWANVYAQNGTISTSTYDAKTDFEALDPVACAQAVLDTDWVAFSYLPPPQPVLAPQEPSPTLKQALEDGGASPFEAMVEASDAAYAAMLEETAPARRQKGYVLQSPDHTTHDLFGLEDRASASPGSDLAVVACALQHALARISALEDANGTPAEDPRAGPARPAGQVGAPGRRPGGGAARRQGDAGHRGRVPVHPGHGAADAGDGPGDQLEGGPGDGGDQRGHAGGRAPVRRQQRRSSAGPGRALIDSRTESPPVDLPLVEEGEHRLAPYGRWCPYCGANLTGVPVEREKPEEAVFALAGRRLKVALAVLFVVIWLAISIYDWFEDPAVALVPGWYSALGAIMLFYLLGFSPVGLLRRR